ncbi:photosystem II reaction center W [Wolffia australiana]|uniref:PSII 6.1 kDa protein n=1 Tax=Wolffia australiana TaxID=161112 RepID=G0YP29_WOLAU|nr:putative chloroplast photosystem II reaction center W-like protein [Wolffia australiana]AEY84993.1 photosystem II reaction center W protein [Wolffia australiana]
MASLGATATHVAGASFLVARPSAGAGASSLPLLGLPRRGGARAMQVKCSAAAEEKKVPAVASLLAAASVMATSNPALALVDERLSTEGTGLSLGISNNLLAWILAGVFGLIWALYFVYTSTLEEDEESGLSL